jgi:transposase
MIALAAHAALKVYLALDPSDLRKGFDGLSALVLGHFGAELSCDALYVFVNKRRDRIKLLYHDSTGLWVATKRLERGRYSWPRATQPGEKKIRLTPEALQLVLDGVDLRGATFKPWYQRAD